MLAHWLDLARHSPLGLLADLDGTLIPFAPTPAQARPDPDLVRLLTAVSTQPGMLLAIVSGRARADLEELFPPSPGLRLVAEHGGWRRSESGWHAQAEVEPLAALAELADGLARLASRHPGARVEPKTWSVAFHYRAVAAYERQDLQTALEDAVARWLAGQPGYERLEGAEVLEVRPSWLRKSTAVGWLRSRGGARTRLLVFGDDRTDEDMFGALGLTDEGIRVGALTSGETHARWTLPGPPDLRAFLEWLRAARDGRPPPTAAPLPAPIASAPGPRKREASYDLLAISNRLPELRTPSAPRDERHRNVGGLVAAIEPALTNRRGLWLGWSGRLAEGPRSDVTLDVDGVPALAWFDFPREWIDTYYNGFCNRVLWPLLHSFPARVRFTPGEWEAYGRVNEAFAASALRLVGPDTPVWVHDYHLFLVARALRRLGHRARIGLFLHVPFPGPDLWGLLPWSDALLDALLDFDLLGFHTEGYVRNFLQCVAPFEPVRRARGGVVHRGRHVAVRAFPLGILPETFQEPPEPGVADEVGGLLAAIAPGRLVLGVDRLDYSKGIPERLQAFERLLERFPNWRGRVSLVQVSVPSREDVPEYAEQRQLVEGAVGRINGRFGDGSWVPVRYLYRSYRRNHLAHLYRAAAVGYVTPLRDGMNLVAKEYVAAQDPDDPGVLLLSRFAGAAAELGDALLTNPWHVDGMADDLDHALRMGLEERRERHRRLSQVVGATTAVTWAADFLAALEA